MRKILVTGGAGMIGSNLVKRLIQLGDNVIVVDNLWRGSLNNLNDENGLPTIDIETNFYNRDLSELDVLDDLLEGVDYVVHLADIVAGIGYVFDNQASIFRKNILINSNTIASVRRSKVKGFLYIGTACSFPESLQDKLDYKLLVEDDLYPAEPESAYGWSKLMGQYETELLSQETNIKTCTLMLHNVYGSPCDYSVERSQVIPSLIRKVLDKNEKSLVVWGSGKQGRAFLHVNDVVDGITAALEKGWGKGHIQLGPNICTSIKDIADILVDISPDSIDILYDTTKPEGDLARAADFSKAERELGWRPKVDLLQGLSDLYNWINKEINETV
jgi:GDP-D-mannose 3', 5'-epimerase